MSNFYWLCESIGDFVVRQYPGQGFEVVSKDTVLASGMRDYREAYRFVKRYQRLGTIAHGGRQYQYESQSKRPR